MYVSKYLYDLLNIPISIDTLFKKFENKTGETITCEYEQTLMLSLCFLFSIELIELRDDKIRRNKNDI